MKVRHSLFCLFFFCLPAPSLAAEMGMEHGNLHALFIDQFEWQGASRYRAEVEGWYGNELQKLSYEFELEKTPDEKPETSSSLGWQSALSAFWDGRLLVRHDRHGDEDRTWFGGGFSGTAPYFVHVDAALFLDDGDVLLDVKLEHEIPLSRQWVMKTQFEMDAVTGDVSGIDEIKLGVRFAYETVHRWSAYTGVEWQRSPLENTQRTALVTGVSYWF